MYFLSAVQPTEVREILFHGSHGEDLRCDAGGEKKISRDTVNDKFPAAAFVSRYPTLNSVYASLSKM